MQNIFYVYEHIRNDTGACFYIGKGKGTRYATPRGRNTYWRRVVNKAGGFTSKIIAANLTEQEAFNFEIAMINGAKAVNCELSNIAKGGLGAAGFTHSIDAKAKISAFNKGKTISEECKKKIGAANAIALKGITRTAEFKEKVSVGSKGKPKSAEHNAKVGAANAISLKGKKHTAERKANTSSAMKLYWEKRKEAQHAKMA
jgi:hypothetical protein